MMTIDLMRGDCLDLMKNIPDNSIDLICCDLPYGTTDVHGGKKSKNRFLEWDNIIPLDKLWIEYKRILKDKGVVCLNADQPFTSKLIVSNLDWFRYEWLWKKNITTGFLLANYRPMKQTEDIIIFSPAGASASSAKGGNCMTYNPQGLVEKIVNKKNNKKRLGKFLLNEEFMGKNNVLLGEKEYTQKATNYPKEIIEFDMDRQPIHPTQKPVALIEYLIKTYSNEGETVLDNCMGSGTTGVACVRTNRNFIGIEMDENYFELAKERIEKEKANILIS
jgi:site-specific DNA-methyltransferase (adenine-specific)